MTIFFLTLSLISNFSSNEQFANYLQLNMFNKTYKIEQNIRKNLGNH